MKVMTKKTTVLFPPKLYRHLEMVARKQKRSVGDLIRDAVAVQYGKGGVAARLRAIDALSKLGAPVADPEQMEREIARGVFEE